MTRPGTMLAAMLVMLTTGASAHAKMEMRTFPVLAGAGAHDVYPAPDGAVWFTAQSAGKLGRLDPRTGKSDLIALGPDAAPHGVIVGPDRSRPAVRLGAAQAVPKRWRCRSRDRSDRDNFQRVKRKILAHPASTRHRCRPHKRPARDKRRAPQRQPAR